MHTNVTRFAALLLAFALILSGGFAASAATEQEANEAERPTVVAMLIDGVVMRPLGLLATAAGMVMWVVTLPVSATLGSAGDARDVLVDEPARFTFKRSLGDFPR